MPGVRSRTGVKLPAPAAMMTALHSNVVPADVPTTKSRSPRFSSVSTVWSKCMTASNGSICFSRLSVSSCPVHSGTAGMSKIGLSG